MMLHAEVMPEAQQDVLRRIGSFATEHGFYLGGGTAVAIHLGHRRSIDLDWFTNDRFTDPLRLATSLRETEGDTTVKSLDEGTLYLEIEGVQVSFIEYPYQLLHPTLEWPDFSCRLASLEDLACMKLSAIAGRGARKDFVDLYALGTSHINLSRMLELYTEKFGISDIGHVLFSLTYFDDAETEAMPEMLRDVRWSDMRRAIEGWVRSVGSF